MQILFKACDGKGGRTLVTDQEIRNFLGGFDFHGSRVDETITNFSGGEKARLALAKVAWLKPNLLLMDEPTNHLDIEMCHALEMALQDYSGAMIIVSHDRHLLSNTVDEFYSIHDGVFAEFSGSIHDYESWLKKTGQLDGVNKASSSNDYNSRTEKPKLDKKEQRQLAAAKRKKLAPIKHKEEKLEKAIEKIHMDLENIKQDLANEGLYQEGNKNKLTEVLQREGLLKSELEEKELEWFSVQQELETS